MIEIKVLSQILSTKYMNQNLWNNKIFKKGDFNYLNKNVQNDNNKVKKINIIQINIK